MADIYKDIAAALSNRRQRFMDEQPALQAALSMQPIYTRRDQNQTKGAIAGGLQGLAKALMGSYGINKAQEESAAYNRDFMNVMGSDNPMEGLAADPRFSDIGAILATDQVAQGINNKRELDLYGKKAIIDAKKQNAVEMQKVLMSDPRFQRALFEVATKKASGGELPSVGAGIAQDPGAMPSVDPSMPQAQSQSSRSNYEQMGLTDLQIVEQQRKDREFEAAQQERQRQFDMDRSAPERAAAEAELKDLIGRRTSIETLDRMGDIVLSNYQRAGDTGGLAPGVQQMGAKLLAPFSEEQKAKALSTDLLNTVKPDAIRINRVPGVGASSDMESAALFGAAASSEQYPENNKFLGELYKARASLERQYVDFKQAYFQTKGTLSGSDDAWQQMLGGRKLVSQGPEGNSVVTPIQVPWREALGQVAQGQNATAQPAAQPQSNMAGAQAPSPAAGQGQSEDIRAAIEARKAQLRQQMQQGGGSQGSW